MHPVMSDLGTFDDILLVENNPGDARLTKEILRERGWNATIHVATDINSVLDFIYQRNDYAEAPLPDIILLDWHLPQTTGAEILSELEETNLESVPLAVLSGSGAELEKLKEEHPQADAYLTKPLNPDDLVRKL